MLIINPPATRSGTHPSPSATPDFKAKPINNVQTQIRSLQEQADKADLWVGHWQTGNQRARSNPMALFRIPCRD